MYLIDTNVISELRKKRGANPGVREFFENNSIAKIPLYLSVITIGELRRGVEMIRHRGDNIQAGQLERWRFRGHRCQPAKSFQRIQLTNAPQRF